VKIWLGRISRRKSAASGAGRPVSRAPAPAPLLLQQMHDIQLPNKEYASKALWNEKDFTIGVFRVSELIIVWLKERFHWY